MHGFRGVSWCLLPWREAAVGILGGEVWCAAWKFGCRVKLRSVSEKPFACAPRPARLAGGGESLEKRDLRRSLPTFRQHGVRLRVRCAKRRPCRVAAADCCCWRRHLVVLKASAPAAAAAAKLMPMAEAASEALAEAGGVVVSEGREEERSPRGPLQKASGSEGLKGGDCRSSTLGSGAEEEAARTPSSASATPSRGESAAAVWTPSRFEPFGFTPALFALAASDATSRVGGLAAAGASQRGARRSACSPEASVTGTHRALLFRRSRGRPVGSPAGGAGSCASPLFVRPRPTALSSRRSSAGSCWGNFSPAAAPLPPLLDLLTWGSPPRAFLGTNSLERSSSQLSCCSAQSLPVARPVFPRGSSNSNSNSGAFFGADSEAFGAESEALLLRPPSRAASLAEERLVSLSGVSLGGEGDEGSAAAGSRGRREGPSNKTSPRRRSGARRGEAFKSHFVAASSCSSRLLHAPPLLPPQSSPIGRRARRQSEETRDYHPSHRFECTAPLLRVRAAEKANVSDAGRREVPQREQQPQLRRERDENANPRRRCGCCLFFKEKNFSCCCAATSPSARAAAGGLLGESGTKENLSEEGIATPGVSAKERQESSSPHPSKRRILRRHNKLSAGGSSPAPCEGGEGEAAASAEPLLSAVGASSSRL